MAQHALLQPIAEVEVLLDSQEVLLDPKELDCRDICLVQQLSNVSAGPTDCLDVLHETVARPNGTDHAGWRAEVADASRDASKASRVPDLAQGIIANLGSSLQSTFSPSQAVMPISRPTYYIFPGQCSC